jgi:hypothetical protein
MSELSNRRRGIARAAWVILVVLSACDGNTPAPNNSSPTAAGPAVSFSTNFSGNETPITEGGVWRHAGLDWTTVKSERGQAHGTQTNSSYAYNDSYAYLSGFPANQSAEAVIYNSSTSSINKEVELLLRWSDSAHSAQGYEINIQHNGLYAQVVRWNGPFGSFQEIARANNLPAPKTGDVYRATIVGTLITVYYNNNQIMQAADSRWATGQPGMGFFVEPGASNSELGFTRFTAKGL